MNIMFSKGWFSDFMNEINANPEYESAAREWEGDIMFVIKGDRDSSILREGMDVFVRLDLFHGKCRAMDYLFSSGDFKTQYCLDGSASEWESVINGNSDLVSAIMKGKIRIEGNTMKLMRYLPAAEQLINSARKVTEL